MNDSTINKLFGQRLRELRENNNLHQEDVGEWFKMRKSTVSQWENGRIPHGTIILELANHFNCTTDYLLGRTDRPYQNNIAPDLMERVGKDLFPKLLAQIEQMDIPPETKQAALKKFYSLTDEEKNDLLPKLVKSAIVAEGKVKYEVNSSLDDEVIQKYKSLPEQDRKAVAAIIDSLTNKQNYLKGSDGL